MKEEKIVPFIPDQDSPRRRRVRKVSKFRLFVLSLLFIAVLLGLIFFVAFRDDIGSSTAAELFADIWNRLTTGAEGDEELVFPDFLLGKSALFRNHLALLTPTDLSIFALSGHNTLQEEFSLHTPAMTASNHTLAVYDRGGHDLLIAGANAVLWRQTLEESILTVRMNAKGDFVVVTFPEGASSRATLYNAKYQPQYQWISSEFYLVSADVSDRADRLALLGMGLRGAEMTGRLLVLDTRSETPQFTHDFSGELLRHVSFAKDGFITVIADSHVYIWSADGLLTETYPYENAQLQDFTAYREGIALLLSDTAGNSQIIWLDNKGQLVGKYDFEGDFISFALYGDNLFVWQGGRLFRYRRDQAEVAELTLEGVKKILARSDNSVVALLENNAKVMTFS